MDFDLTAAGQPLPMAADLTPTRAGEVVRQGAVRPGGIELRGLTKRYGNETVVNAIDVSIAPGEFFSLLGPSGSGKTTTLMMVAGFVHPDSGAILLDGQDIASMPPQKRGFGMVFQNYAIFPHLNVFENIAFPLRARRWPKSKVAERVNWALDAVQLGRFADRFARQLSGGQQQRVALARAIVFHPSVVLMDEPLGALDKNLRYDMQVEIKEIQQRLGMTVIYVTHDQEEAMGMSDRMAIMNHGRIDQVGKPGVVYEQPVNPFVGRFLGEANLIEGTVTSAHGDRVRLVLSGGEALHAPRGNGYDSGPCLLFIRPERVDIMPGGIMPGGIMPGGIMAGGIMAGGQAEADPRFNVLTGRVRRCSFLGNILRYAVDVDGISPVTIDLQNAVGVSPLDRGTAVTLRWPVADSLILPAGGLKAGTA
jgi:ABC-type Fe3+/spermidine/putrescine transport system ATPase subunit